MMTPGNPLQQERPLKPVAEPGWPQSVKGNNVVRLEGGTSFDPNNSALTYAWTLVMGQDVVLDSNLSESLLHLPPQKPPKKQVLHFKQLSVVKKMV